MQHPVPDPRATAHLDAERLAALADEPATPAESAHLAACAACRREREMYVALVALARAEGTGDRPADAYAPAAGDGPLDAAGGWDALASTLRAEGLVSGAEGTGSDSVRRVGQASGASRWAESRWAGRHSARRGVGAWAGAWAGRAPFRLAAGVLLAVGAAAAGRASATRGPFAVEASAAGAFASSDDARTTLARARRDYARAAAFLAAADGVDAAEDDALAGVDRDPRAAADAELLRARLATLDALLPRVRAAARQAPEDPAVNQLYLAAYDARETALRQLGRTLPAGVQLTGY